MMGETPNEKTGQPDSSEVSQADIDALMNGGVTGNGGAAADADPAGREEEASSSESPGNIDRSDSDALLQGGDGQPGDGAVDAETVAQGAVNQTDIDAILGEAAALVDDAGSTPPDGQADESPRAHAPVDTRLDSLGRPFDDGAAEMQAAIEEERAADDAAAVLADSKAFDLPDFGDDQPFDVRAERVTMLNDVQLCVKLQLGRTRMLVEDILKLGDGSVVELDKLAGDPIDVLVNDRLVARGEVLVLNDVFCVRVSEVVAHDPHRVTT